MDEYPIECTRQIDVCIKGFASDPSLLVGYIWNRLMGKWDGFMSKELTTINTKFSKKIHVDDGTTYVDPVNGQIYLYMYANNNIRLDIDYFKICLKVCQDGARGPTGDTGPQGVDGIHGIQGFTGPQGIVGEKGHTGPRGEKGDIGDTGLTGLSGSDGIQGAQGIQGIQGPHGLHGPTGPHGEKGETGDRGETTSQLATPTGARSPDPAGGTVRACCRDLNGKPPHSV